VVFVLCFDFEYWALPHRLDSPQVIIPLYRQRGAKDDEIQAVFQNIDDLIALHTRLAEQFQLLGANPRSAFALFVFTFKISKILGNLSHHMKYMSGYENATKQYQKLSASYGDYHAPNGLDVPGHIIIPVRRIPRYVLLFKVRWRSFLVALASVS
jgi:hypothetical protein